jgi:hypothetical protein
MRSNAAGCLWLSGLAILAAGLAIAVPVSAQIPDEFTNLQVLPEEIGRQELLTVMRDFASALGVRCNHCHVGESGNSLEGYDFASDEPEPKQVARAMMKMTYEINGKLLPTTGRTSLTRVRCATCHGGLTNPVGLKDLLNQVIEDQGIDDAADRYRELRKKYYGSRAYDFGPAALIRVAEKLAETDQDVKGAIIMMQLNIETNDDSAASYLMLAQLFMASNEKARSLVAVQRALELEPDNRFAQRMLSRLNPEPAPRPESEPE